MRISVVSTGLKKTKSNEVYLNWTYLDILDTWKEWEGGRAGERQALKKKKKQQQNFYFLP